MLLHLPPKIRLSQCVDTASRERQINRAAGAHSYAAHVRPTLVNFHLITALNQTESEERPVEASTNQGNSLGFLSHRGIRLSIFYSVSSVLASHNSGKNFLSSVS